MQTYLNVYFNHVRALQAWADARGARLMLDLRSFELEVKWRGRYYPMYPIFQARAGGRQVHAMTLPGEVIGFGGWRPYRALQHDHSTHKLWFKRALAEQGVATPRWLAAAAEGEPVPFDHVVKADTGSFGRQIAGPFRAGTPFRDPWPRADGEPPGTFAEAFVRGTILKVWFWGGRPFFAHAHEFPTIHGNGIRSTSSLLEERLARAGLDWKDYEARALVVDSLRFQGVDEGAVLAAGLSPWFDFRYSHRYEPRTGVSAKTDDALPQLAERTGEQIARMGAALRELLQKDLPAPVLVTIDGMLDANGTIQWLEMNTNSIMPPESYAAMFDDLFH